MGRTSTRRCAGCGAALPAGVRASRRFCDAACRAVAWRERRRSSQAYAAAVAELVAAGIAQGPSSRQVRAQYPSAACPVCGRRWWVTVSRRSDAVYCSPRCRTAAWRERTGQVPQWLAGLRAQQARLQQRSS
ncbi:hypothetical protein AB0I72_08870 [Nocardiopsis sp. NPDC049922]|uniref:hypothetical protein n=1 Tax=Nocardiopsis sp. NPDC049922 TaxID=3155157 RepID=UPI0033E4D362